MSPEIFVHSFSNLDPAAPAFPSLSLSSLNTATTLVTFSHANSRLVTLTHGYLNSLLRLLYRCMALSTVIFVGETEKWIPDLVEKAKKLRVGAGIDPATDVGPLISVQVLDRGGS